MIRVMKENRLDDLLAASGIATKIQLFKAMKRSKTLSAMVIIRGLSVAGFILFLLGMSVA